MSVESFYTFFSVVIFNLSRFWNMFSSFVVAGIPWTRWVLLIFGAGLVLGILKHSFSDTSGFTVSNTVTKSRKGG